MCSPLFDQCEEMYIYVQNYTPAEEMLLKIICDHSLMGYGRQKICNLSSLDYKGTFFYIV